MKEELEQQLEHDFCRKAESRKKEIHIKYLGVSVAMDGMGLSMNFANQLLTDM